ncbi:HupE/UreJ family protein [Gemmobacter serpentinus]|uniref:HupE/UreJ family protein n=1 Tax=Gemmobacter serpentinus TaxID=2652247 RepID=UPI00124D49F6|nr:HupE/UreJ family protein [Gemmobacter serpentinus]
MKRILLPLLLLPHMALAHGGAPIHSPFASGLAHPAGGLDHVLAMVAVGLWAVMIGGRAIWALPLAFVAAMIAGGLAGALGIPLPGVEPMILASIVVLGVAAALALKPKLTHAIIFVVIFGVFHGHAHGAEGPATGLAAYAAGFALMTMGLHLAGVAIGATLMRFARGVLPRVLGGLTALGGVILAIGG